MRPLSLRCLQRLFLEKAQKGAEIQKSTAMNMEEEPHSSWKTDIYSNYKREKIWLNLMDFCFTVPTSIVPTAEAFVKPTERQRRATEDWTSCSQLPWWSKTAFLKASSTLLHYWLLVIFLASGPVTCPCPRSYVRFLWIIQKESQFNCCGRFDVNIWHAHWACAVSALCHAVELFITMGQMRNEEETRLEANGQKMFLGMTTQETDEIINRTLSETFVNWSSMCC